jgi:hypothetical protein
VVKGVDVFSERLRGMLASKDAWKRLDKGGFTVAASEAARANAQAGGLPKAFDMAHPALIKSFALDASASAPSAGSRPFLWGLEVYFKAIRLDGLVENFITTDSDGFKEARHTGTLNPMSPIFDQEPAKGRKERKDGTEGAWMGSSLVANYRGG